MRTVPYEDDDIIEHPDHPEVDRTVHGVGEPETIEVGDETVVYREGYKKEFTSGIDDPSFTFRYAQVEGVFVEEDHDGIVVDDEYDHPSDEAIQDALTDSLEYIESSIDIHL